MWLNENLKKMVRNRKIKFDEIAKQWLEYKKNSIKESTYSKYDYTINKYLLPKFKNKSLAKLKDYDFNKLVGELKEGLSPKTIRDILCILKSILSFAEQEYECHFKKKRIVVQKLNASNLVILSKREQSRLENRCLKINTLTSLGIIIAMNTGIRIGEICGLKWKNIDLEKRILYVKCTLQRIYDRENRTTKVILDTPKTQTSVREIPISNKLYEILQPLKKNYNEEDFFLTGSEEIFIEPRRFQYIFKDILRRARMRSYKFHILRHTFATECIEVGMDVKSLSEVLGHSSVDITLNRYVHSSYKTKRKYLEKL